MAWIHISNLGVPDGDGTVTTPAWQDPDFYGDDTDVVLMQRDPNGNQANATKRIVKRCVTKGNIFVEIGVFRENGVVVFTFDGNQHVAALPCPPFDNELIGTGITSC